MIELSELDLENEQYEQQVDDDILINDIYNEDVLQ